MKFDEHVIEKCKEMISPSIKMIFKLHEKSYYYDLITHKVTNKDNPDENTNIKQDNISLIQLFTEQIGWFSLSVIDSVYDVFTKTKIKYLASCGNHYMIISDKERFHSSYVIQVENSIQDPSIIELYQTIIVSFDDVKQAYPFTVKKIQSISNDMSIMFTIENPIKGLLSLNYDNKQWYLNNNKPSIVIKENDDIIQQKKKANYELFKRTMQTMDSLIPQLDLSDETKKMFLQHYQDIFYKN